MRVLFVSAGEAPDYQCDVVLHGLRHLFGDEVVDVRRAWYMYAGDFAAGGRDKSALYGRGFTMFGLLGDDSGVDRDDIERKIATRYFDLVVFGSIWRCRDHLPTALAHYPPERIVFVDGEDEQTLFSPLVGRGLYMKRELSIDSPLVHPIQFGIPREKIAPARADKTRVEAFIDPRDRATYIYDTEAAYYGGYAESLFGLTMKKAGWDCLRHYEILANACVPLFLDIESCPTQTMRFLPKYELQVARQAHEANGPDYFSTADGRATWERLWAVLDHALHAHLTTIAVARYLVDVVRRPEAPGLLRFG